MRVCGLSFHHLSVPRASAMTRTKMQQSARKRNRVPVTAGDGYQAKVETAALTEEDRASNVVQKQLDTYNARDLDAFLDVFSDDVVVTDTETGAILCEGKEALRPRYVARFSTPVHAALLSRVACGSTVIDRELITGLPDDAEADCMATYVVKDGKIVRTSFVWRPRPTKNAN